VSGVNIRLTSIKMLPGEPRAFVYEDPAFRNDLHRRMKGRVLPAAKRFVGVDTGRLRANTREQSGVLSSAGPFSQVVSGWTGTQGGSRSYVMPHHDGSPPHIIRARRAKALRFTWKGEVVFFRQVRHPGTRGTKFLTRALPFAAD
jgi:hypothetical protein